MAAVFAEKGGVAAAAEEMMVLLECFYVLLTSPKRAGRIIMEQHTLAQAAMIVVVASLLSTLGGLSAQFLTGVSGILLALVYGLGAVFLWGLMAAVCHLFASLLGGTGEVRQFLKVLGFVDFLDVLLLPLYFLAALVDSAALFAGASLGIWLWKCALYVMAVQTVYAVSAGKALLILVLPFLVILAMLLLGGILGVSIVLDSFGGVLPGGWLPAQL